MGSRWCWGGRKRACSARRDCPAVLEPEYFAKLGFHLTKFAGRQFTDLADNHFLFDCPDDARYGGRKQQACLTPRLDFVVANQQPAHVAGNGREDGVMPTSMVTVGAHDQSGALLCPLLIGEHEPHEDDIA